MKSFISDLSNMEFPENEKISAKSIRPTVYKLIVKEHPEFTKENFLSLTELNLYREKAISNYLKKEKGALSDLENNVLRSIKDNTTISQEVEDDKNQKLTVGQRIADKVATFGGSWTFIITFGTFILFWIVINVFLLINKAFDPYPFILLNLILSCLAAMQAPVIMMSQNRQEEKDRERAKNDYMINLKSELEIRVLHEKIDHFILNQQQELFEIQKTQIELMNGILKHFEKSK
jgi:uncharacterized membrane protein